MVSKNDIAGDSISSKPNSDAYRDNWDRIFGKKEVPKEEEEFRRCSERAIPLPKEIDTSEKFVEWVKSQKESKQ